MTESGTLSVGAVEYADCISAEGYDHPPTSVLNMTLNNQMVRLLPDPLWPGVVAADRTLSMS